jgi:hypothetical protein
MTNVLREALARVEELPESDQENIGRQVLTHVEKLRALRADIDAGVGSLDAGEGKEIEIDKVISRTHGRHTR